MRQLTKKETMIMLGGGILMVLSAGIMMATTLMSEAAWAESAVLIVPWLFLIGAVSYVTMQRMQTYSGSSLTMRRLRSIQFISGILLILAGLFMLENYYHFVQPLVVSDINSYFTYLQVVHNNWVVLILIAAILQMYTAHRISYEMQKES